MSPNIWGVDIDQPVSAALAAEIKESFDFIGRYAPRTAASNSGNITASETELLLNAGLSVFCTQHVENDGWEPSQTLGEQYGSFGAEYVLNVARIFPGCCFFLDLEGISTSAKPGDVIAYCNAWYDAVSVSGLIPSLYVGWGCILSPDQLYDELKFKNYWRSYNGDGLSVRGYQMVQHTGGVISGVPYDKNMTMNDNMGDCVSFFSPV